MKRLHYVLWQSKTSVVATLSEPLVSRVFIFKEATAV